ncbi:MAG TPA: hypothetical protein DIC36_00720 [Gammaproteobacteria bacterium]|nr:hypothetical protein [Gammaproteobacteria bacterium]
MAKCDSAPLYKNLIVAPIFSDINRLVLTWRNGFFKNVDAMGVDGCAPKWLVDEFRFPLLVHGGDKACMLDLRCAQIARRGANLVRQQIVRSDAEEALQGA